MNRIALSQPWRWVRERESGNARNRSPGRRAGGASWVLMVVCRIGATLRSADSLRPLRTIWRVRHFLHGNRKGRYAVLTRCPACNNETRLAFQIPWLAAFELCPSCAVMPAPTPTARTRTSNRGRPARACAASWCTRCGRCTGKNSARFAMRRRQRTVPLLGFSLEALPTLSNVP